MAVRRAANFCTLLFIVTVIVSESLGQRNSCSPPTSKKFASKTAYRNADTPSSSQPVQFPGCVPVQIYGIYRHGTRYPSVTDVQAMNEKMPGLRDLIIQASDAGNGSLCSQDLIKMKSWKLDFNGSMTNHLHTEGRLEANAIARRLKNRFSEIFSKSYSPDVYQFRTTNTQRTDETAKNFIQGIFETADKGVDVITKENEDLLRFYKSCKRWESEVDDNDTAIDEYFKFTNGPEMHDVGARIAQKIGLATPLNFYNISILYETCRFETAWNRFPLGSPWCNLFSNEDLDILEYSEDLLYYWKDGYGYPINYEQACPILVDLFKHFNNFKNPSTAASEPAAIFHFTHSGLLLKFYARLGLFNDSKPLLADDYSRQSGRKWRTSTIDPFGNNIAFVLLNCTDQGVSPTSQLNVLAYVQEKEVFLSNCTSTLCPLDTVLATYGRFTEHCDLEQMCKSNTSALNALSVYLVTVAVALFAYNAVL